MRREMDGDRDREVTREEASAHAKALESRIGEVVRWTIGGRAARPEWQPAFSEDAVGAMRSDPFSIELGLHLPVVRGEAQTLVLSDRFGMREIERTTITTTAVAPAVLVAAGPRRAPRSLEPGAMFAEVRGETVERVFGVRFRTPAPPASPVMKWIGVGAGIVALAAVAIALRRVSGRRRGS